MTWDWTPVSQTIGEHSTHQIKDPLITDISLEWKNEKFSTTQRCKYGHTMYIAGLPVLQWLIFWTTNIIV